MSEPFIVYQPCVTYTEEEHSELLDWVRDENNADHPAPDRSDTQTANLFWEANGRLFTCPGNAIYAAKGNPDKVRRCYLLLDGYLRSRLNINDCHYPMGWLDRKRTHA